MEASEGSGRQTPGVKWQESWWRRRKILLFLQRPWPLLVVWQPWHRRRGLPPFARLVIVRSLFCSRAIQKLTISIRAPFPVRSIFLFARHSENWRSLFARLFLCAGFCFFLGLRNGTCQLYFSTSPCHCAWGRAIIRSRRLCVWWIFAPKTFSVSRTNFLV